eukprot:UN13360
MHVCLSIYLSFFRGFYLYFEKIRHFKNQLMLSRHWVHYFDIVVILSNPSKAFHFPLALFSTLAISFSIPHPFASARFPSTLLLFSSLPDHASDL